MLDPQTIIDNNTLNNFINESTSFDVHFKNGPGSDIGFGPMFDFVSEKGINVSSDFTLVGTWSTTDNAWLNSSEQEITAHPYGSVAEANTEIPSVPNNSKEWRWYIKRLDFSSYGPDQPETPVTVSYSLDEDDGAVLNTGLTFRIRPAFRFGTDAEHNYSQDPMVVGSWSSMTLNPVLIKLTKKNNRPESETATGPNYPVKYNFTINVANGKTITDLVLTDPLSTSLQYNENSAQTTVKPNATTETSSHNTGSYDTIFTYDTLSGSSGSEIKCEYEVHVPYKKRNTQTLILNKKTGASASISETATLTYYYDGVQYSIQDDDTLIARSIAIQKNKSQISTPVDRISNQSYYMPEDTVKYTWSIQVSDYFDFRTLTVNDKLSGGQTFNNSSFNVKYYQNGNTLLNKSNIGTSNSNLVQSILSNYDVPSSNSLTAEGTQLDFDIGQLLIDELSLSTLDIYGGRVDLQNNDVDETLTNNKTYFEIDYTVSIDEQYENTNLSDTTLKKLDFNDKLDNTVQLTSKNFDFRDNKLQSDVTESSDENLNIGYYNLDKIIYGIKRYSDNSFDLITNPADYTSSNSSTNHEKVYAKDQVTYKVTLTLSHQYIQDLVITDFVPPPIMSVADFNLNEQTTLNSNNVPDLNRFTILDETTFPYQSTTGFSVSTNNSANSIVLDFGTYQNTDSLEPVKIAIMYTLECDNQPCADELRLTNQAYVSFTNTTGDTLTSDSFTKIVINQPIVQIKKSAVRLNIDGTDSSIDGTESYAFGQIGDSNGFTSNGSLITLSAMDNIDYDAGTLLPGNKVRIAVMIKNIGNSTSYNTKIKDVLPVWLQLISNSIRITDGNGNNLLGNSPNYSSIESDLFSTGYTIDNINKETVVVMTYDAIIQHSSDSYIEANSSFFNTASIEEFTNIQTNGTNFVGNSNVTLSNLSDTCSFTTPAPTINKKILQTSESHTYYNTSNDISTNSRTTNSTIGEHITMQVQFTVPPLCKLTDAQIKDIIYRSYSQLLQPTNSTHIVYDLSQATNLTFDTSDQPNLSGSVYTNNNTYHNFGTIRNTGSTEQTITFTYKYIILDHPQLVYNTSSQKKINTRAHLNYGSKSIRSNNTQIRIREPTLSITKSHPSGQLGYPGSNIDYTIQVKNIYGTRAYGVSFTDTLPDVLKINSVTYPGSVTEQINGSTQTISYQGNSDITKSILDLNSYWTITANCTVRDTEDPVGTVSIGENYTNTAYTSYATIGSYNSDSDQTIDGYNDTISTPIGRSYTKSVDDTFTPIPEINMSILNQTYNHGTKNGNITGAIYDKLKHTINIKIPKGTTNLNSLILDIPELANFDETYHNSLYSTNDNIEFSWIDPNSKLSSTDGFTLPNSSLTRDNVNNKLIFDLNDFIITNTLLPTDSYNSTIQEYLQIVFYSKISTSLQKSNDVSITPTIQINTTNGTVDTSASSKSYTIVEPTINIDNKGVYMPFNTTDSMTFNLVLTNNHGYASHGFNPLITVSDLSKYFSNLSLVTENTTDPSRISNFNYNNGTLTFNLDILSKNESFTVQVTGQLDPTISDFPLNEQYTPYSNTASSNSITYTGSLQVSSQSDTESNGEYLYTDSDDETIFMGKQEYTYPDNNNQYCICFEDTTHFDYDYEDVVLNGEWTMYNKRTGVHKIIIDVHARARGADYNHVFGLYIENLTNRSGTWDLYTSLNGAKITNTNQEVFDYLRITDNKLSTLATISDHIDIFPMFISTHKYLPKDELGAQFKSTIHTCNTNDRTEGTKEWTKPSSGRLVITLTDTNMDLNIKIKPHLGIMRNNKSILYYKNLNDQITFGDVFSSNSIKNGVPRCIMSPIDLILGHDHSNYFSAIYPQFESWDLIDEDKRFTNLDIISDPTNCEWANNPNSALQLKTKASQYSISGIKDIDITKNFHLKRTSLYPKEATLYGPLSISGSSENSEIFVGENKGFSKIVTCENSNTTYFLKRNGDVTYKSNGSMTTLWSNIIDITKDNTYLYGLTDDQTILTNNSSLDLSSWTNIYKISCCSDILLGIDNDGVLYEENLSSGSHSGFNISSSDFNKMIDISVSCDIIVSLNEDKLVNVYDTSGNIYTNIFNSTKVKRIHCFSDKVFAISKGKQLLCMKINKSTATTTDLSSSYTNWTNINKVHITDIDSDNYFLAAHTNNGTTLTDGTVPNSVNSNNITDVVKLYTDRNNIFGIKL